MRTGHVVAADADVAADQVGVVLGQSRDAGTLRTATTTSRKPGANRSKIPVTVSAMSSVDPAGTWT